MSLPRAVRCVLLRLWLQLLLGWDEWSPESSSGNQCPLREWLRQWGENQASSLVTVLLLCHGEMEGRLLFHQLNAIILSTVPKKTGILPEENSVHQKGKNVHDGKYTDPSGRARNGRRGYFSGWKAVTKSKTRKGAQMGLFQEAEAFGWMHVLLPSPKSAAGPLPSLGRTPPFCSEHCAGC